MELNDLWDECVSVCVWSQLSSVKLCSFMPIPLISLLSMFVFLESLFSFQYLNLWHRLQKSVVGKCDYSKNLVSASIEMKFDSKKTKGVIPKMAKSKLVTTKERTSKVATSTSKLITSKTRFSNITSKWATSKNGTSKLVTFGTLNVQTLKSKENLSELEEAFIKSNLAVVGLSEVRREGEKLT